MEHIRGIGEITKCQSLRNLADREKSLNKNVSLPNILKNLCEINFSQFPKKEENNIGTLPNGHCENLQTNQIIPFQQKIETLVGKSHKREPEKSENSGKIGLFQWFLRFFGVFFVSLRFPPSRQSYFSEKKISPLNCNSHSLRTEFELFVEIVSVG